MTPASQPELKQTAMLQKAMLHQERRDFTRAETLYRKILRSQPGNIDALHLCGVVRGELGDLDQAESFIRRALQLRPSLAAAWSNLGNILLAQSRAADAAAAYCRAIQAEPSFAPAHHNLAKLLATQARHAEALQHARHSCALQPLHPSSWLLRAEICQALGHASEAEAALRRCAGLMPGVSEPWTNLGNLLAGAGRTDEAIVAHVTATRADPASPVAWYGLAAAQRNSARITDALASVEAALKVGPGLAEAWDLKGVCLRSIGRFEEAIACFEEAVRRRPGFAQAIRHITLSRKGRDGEAERLRALLDQSALTADEAISTYFALGKLLDDQDRYDEALAAFAAANARMRQRLAAQGLIYDPKAAEDAAYEAARPSRQPEAAGGASMSDLPVFVVGMPRSGTSLVEQILASHPSISGAGELGDLSRLFGDASAQAEAGIAPSYVAGLRRRAPAAMRVIDKMPDNIVLLRKLSAILPQARVILCRRDARDTALSCFMTRFAKGNTFAYDLWSCGHRAETTERLAGVLADDLALQHTVISYEALVADLEGEARRLIAFTGLPWHDACLQFHRTERPVLTASAWQVRQPIFHSSVGRWRRYRTHLGPLFEGQSAAASGWSQREVQHIRAHPAL